MGSDSKTQDLKKKNRLSSPRFWVRPHHNSKWWDGFMNGNMILEEVTESFRMTERSFYILCEELQQYSQS